jgi:hypothetical protein
MNAPYLNGRAGIGTAKRFGSLMNRLYKSHSKPLTAFGIAVGWGIAILVGLVLGASTVSAEDPPVRDDQYVSDLRDKASALGVLRVILQLDVSTQPEGKLPNNAAISDQRNRIRMKQDAVVEQLSTYAIRRAKKFRYIPIPVCSRFMKIACSRRVWA